MFESKAKFASKVERTREYVSILKRIPTRASGKIGGFNSHF